MIQIKPHPLSSFAKEIAERCEREARNLENTIKEIREALREKGYTITKERKGDAYEIRRMPRRYSPVQLIDNPPAPPRFIIPGFLPEGLCALAASPKTGKSWLALSLSCSIATGEPFLGFTVPQPGDVFYYDLESSQSRVWSRLQKMRVNVESLGRLSVSHESALMGMGLEKDIDAWCDEVERPSLVIIDTIARAKPQSRRSENAYESDSRLFAGLQRLAIERHICIMVITHRKKGAPPVDDPYEAITGTMGLVGVADMVSMIQAPREQEVKSFVFTGRDVEHTEISIALNKDTMTWEYVSQAAILELEAKRARATFDSDPLVGVLLKVIKDNGGGLRGTAREIAQILAEASTTPLVESEDKLGKRLMEVGPLLSKFAGIEYKAPMYPEKGGRIHRFGTACKKGDTQTPSKQSTLFEIEQTANT